MATLTLPPKKSFDIWMGVRLSVEAESMDEAEVIAGYCLENCLNIGSEYKTSVTSISEPRNLVDIAVQILNRTGQDRRGKT